ncbi:hypothetical protein [Paenibacillus sp. UNC451MF]|uniref:hypothetical protein n=1 Tax=Paenibacillus sp. UNC451MF TaxID=1449063 RepID=UPI00048F3750|nr:hypothetical protein [Paenibacillus sp. UNC451MF]
MHLTVEQALLIYPLSEAGVIAGKSGTSRVIKSVNVMDAPDILTKCLQGVIGGLQEGKVTRLCVSNKKKRPDSLLEAYNECVGSYGLAERLGLKDAIVQFEIVELSYLFQKLPQGKMRTYCVEVLDALLNKDPEYSREMLRTLEAFIENDG